MAQSMLLAFRAENVRSFRDPLELSLEATAMAEDGVPRGVPWREGGKRLLYVLPAAGIFGANASGKTNLLRVMDDMRRIVLTSLEPLAVLAVYCGDLSVLTPIQRRRRPSSAST